MTTTTTIVERPGVLGDHPAPDDHQCGEPAWYVVPPRFFEDHEDRACLMHDNVIVRPGRSTVEVFLRPCDVADLMSDAEYYGSSVSELDAGMFGVCVSAAATVRRLEKQGVARRHNWTVMR